MGTTDDQHYETEAVVDLMIDAACGNLAYEQLNEIVEHFVAQHTPPFKGAARQFLGTLAFGILDVVNGFGFRIESKRFPYIRLEAKAGLYLMKKIQV